MIIAAAAIVAAVVVVLAGEELPCFDDLLEYVDRGDLLADAGDGFRRSFLDVIVEEDERFENENRVLDVGRREKLVEIVVELGYFAVVLPRFNQEQSHVFLLRPQLIFFQRREDPSLRSFSLKLQGDELLELIDNRWFHCLLVGGIAVVVAAAARIAG